MKLDIRNDAQVANLLGIVFLVVMVLGFIPNPIVGPDGVFMTNTAHNLVHGLLGLILIAGAKKGFGKKALVVVGALYLVVAVLGYFGKTDMLLGMVMINPADNYLHLLLAIVLVGAGAYVKPSKA